MLSDVASYKALTNSKLDLSGIAFNPNDGVMTEQIINLPSGSTLAPDYLVCYETDESNLSTIDSRWFVTEWTRTRKGQYKATLRRDVIADHYGSIKDSPIYIERGPLAATDNLIYSKEGNSFNQIKKSETLLKDETEEAWIVGYIPSAYNDDGTSIVSIYNDISYPTPASLGIVLGAAGFSGLGTASAIITDRIYAFGQAKLDWRTRYQFGTDLERWFAQVGVHDQDTSYLEVGVTAGLEDSQIGIITNNSFVDSDRLRYLNKWKSHFNNATVMSEVLTLLNTSSYAPANTNYTDLENLNKLLSGDVIVRDPNTDKLYKVNIYSNVTNNRYYSLTLVTGPSLYTYFNNIVADETFREELNLSGDVVGTPYGISYNDQVLTLTFTEVATSEQIKVTLSNSRNKVNDAPYDMFCMKFNQQNLALAQAIAKKLVYGQNIYDIQILPYCPARFIIDNDSLVANVDYSNITTNPTSPIIPVPVDKLYYCKRSSDSFTINTSIVVPNHDNDPAKRIKISTEVDLHRLTSPNYASSFEFNVAKNDGVNGFRVDFTYRPISPYIHVAPLFSGLYGTINNDARGLICSGDFSIDVISNAWQTYQVQNKNYENIFNTKIKSLDYEHDLSLMSNITGLAAGTARGLITGAVAGGNPVSMAVGAAAGLTSSITNLVAGEAKFRDQRQVQIDMYNYQLGNIKALPDTLTKVSAYNINNKYFPVVEYYSCTQEEIELLKLKYTYQSYLTMRIGTIQSLIDDDLISQTASTFIKGQVIRLNNLNEDDHMANEIYNELYKGVYL